MLNVIMDYLIRFVQFHPSFRIAELEALAKLHEIELEVLEYSEYVRFYVSLSF